MEAVILAGGLGSRLKGIINNIPKPMAYLNGKPFLEYILMYLRKYLIRRVIMSVGYKYKIIYDYFGKKFYNIVLDYSIEYNPLGTGGALIKALDFCDNSTVFILNGDSFFNIDLMELKQYHENKDADITLSLKPMINFNRYGAVIIDNEDRIIRFKEKQYIAKGLINAGVYILEKNWIKQFNYPNEFSLETFLETHVDSLRCYGFVSESYFIDIGVPEDYIKANLEIKRMHE